MKHRYFNLILFIASLVIFISCDNSRVYEKNLAIPGDGWNKDSVVGFDIEITDTLQKHNFYINVRNDIKYEYSNLWLFIETISPKNIAVTDTLEITLADPTGKWLGEGFGGVKDQQILYRKDVLFPHSGEYTVNIRQGMREDELKGITNIGVRIEKKE